MIFQSPRPDVEIPDRSLPDFLIEHASRRGGKTAFVDGPSGRALTCAQWITASRATATGFAARGMAKGGVLAVFSPNLPEYPVAFFGAALAGGVVTTANPLYTSRELREQLLDSEAAFLLTVPPLLATAREAAAGTRVREIFVFGEAEGATPFAELQTYGDNPPKVPIDPREDLVALPYSSGTTGLPKGVMLTHRNMVANIEQTRTALRLSADDTLLGLLPFYHSYGMLCLMCGGLRLGSTVVTLPRFDLEQLLGTLEKYRVTFAHLVPPMILALAKHPVVERFDLSTLRAICSGAAPLGAELARACAQRIGCDVMQGYGLTETSPVTHLASPTIALEDPGSIGCSVSNTEVKLIDESGRGLPPGEPGEICIRGPQVMKGYLNRPEDTAEMIDAEGWLHTGDVGTAGVDGRIYVIDRVKELIKYKGCQVAPAELEALLLSHADVTDAAVIGVPDEQAGELPKAFLVLRGKTSPDEIASWVAERVAPFKRIRLVEAVDQIPKSPSGKILRRVLLGGEKAG